MMIKGDHVLKGEYSVIKRDDTLFPSQLKSIPDPPRELYVCGELSALQYGLAVVGARKATPYGISCAQRFSRIAAQSGVVVISGGAMGCDAAAHEAALSVKAPTVVVLGGGLDRLYPAQHKTLFQEVVAKGGAVISEYPWDTPAKPFQFRRRNRIIAGLSRATLIVEAGIPSGTFSTADEALSAGREVLVVPGAITADSSRGSNRLIYQGATPVVDDETFSDVLLSLFGCLKHQSTSSEASSDYLSAPLKRIANILQSEALTLDQLCEVVQGEERRTSSSDNEWSHREILQLLVEGEQGGLFARYPDGRWGPVVRLH